MKLVERILVGLSLRTETEDVLAAASVLGQKLGSKLSLLHVTPPLPSFPKDADQADVETLVNLGKEGAAQQLAGHKAALEEQGLSVDEPVVVEGAAFEQILSQADEVGANLILVGANSTESENRTELGITPERLCRRSFRPVWLVRPGSSAAPRSILCPVDFSPPSSRALKNAVFLARAFDAELTVLTVVPPLSALYGPLGRDKGSIQSAHEERHAQAFDEFLHQFDFHDLRMHKLVRNGSPVKEILGAIAHVGADLTIMGSVGRTGLSRMLLGSVAERVLEEMPSSMLLMKAEDTFRIEAAHQLSDIEAHFERGAELLKNGFTEEASRQFEHCVSANLMFVPGWEALADCYERLKDPKRAEECRSQAKKVRETLSWRRIEAEVRSKHPLWGRGK